ncbi:MAG: OB-fold nucleic acid binding domain-containing protein [Acidobacteriota bacterium]
MAKLYFHYSTMNAGKSTMLLQASHNYAERGMSTVLLTAQLDHRAGEGKIGSRIGIEQSAETYTAETDLYAFTIALLNAWPMGFYHPATIVQDAKRHGVEVRPIDVTRSAWRCTWEDRDESAESTTAAEPPRHLIDRRLGPRPAARPEPNANGALRLGLRFVRGLHAEVGRRIEASREQRPFADLDDLALRCRLGEDALSKLAHAGALGGLGMSRREALWQASRVARPTGPLFTEDRGRAGSPLPEMDRFEETVADFLTTGLTPGGHPMRYARPDLDTQGVVPCAELARLPTGRTVRVAGAVIVRQRPGTAKGMLFMTLEDETGMAQAILTPDQLDRHRELIVGSAGLVVEGELQNRDGSISVKAASLWRIDRLTPTPSHDWH